MLDGVPVGLADGVSVVALLVILFWMLATGRLATGRELTEKTKRIETLEQQVRNRDEQVDVALAVLPEVADVLRKFHVAAEETREARD